MHTHNTFSPHQTKQPGAQGSAELCHEQQRGRVSQLGDGMFLILWLHVFCLRLNMFLIMLLCWLTVCFIVLKKFKVVSCFRHETWWPCFSMKHCFYRSMAENFKHLNQSMGRSSDILPNNALPPQGTPSRNIQSVLGPSVHVLDW